MAHVSLGFRDTPIDDVNFLGLSDVLATSSGLTATLTGSWTSIMRLPISVLSYSNHSRKTYRFELGAWNRQTTVALLNAAFLATGHKILECGPMPNLMVALPNIGGALCSTPQSLADAHY